MALMISVLCQPLEADAEQEERREPLLGVYLQPMFSATLPGGSATPVTDVYGSVHPTGAVGLSFHPSQRFTLALDLEFHAWRGELPAVTPPEEGSSEIEAFPLTFLNYWMHLRSRVMLLRSGRIRLDADIMLGLVFGREDGDRFRAEGIGVSIGLGPILSVALGNYVALTFSAAIDTGWVFYDVKSPQSTSDEASYTLVWPRIVLGFGIHGFLAHKRPRPQDSSRAVDEDAQEATPPEEGSESSPDSEAQPNDTPPQPEDDIQAPW